MINNVLDFAKIEEGKREFLFAPADLRGSCATRSSCFEPQFRQGGFRLTVDLAPDLPMAEVDAQAITQCLINLVDNAVEVLQRPQGDRDPRLGRGGRPCAHRGHGPRHWRGRRRTPSASSRSSPARRPVWCTMSRVRAWGLQWSVTLPAPMAGT